MVSPPNPHQSIRQCLLENPTVAVTCRQAEDKSVMVTLGVERRAGPLTSHHPVVMSLFGIIRAIIIF
jgi:hypothetical protein